MTHLMEQEEDIPPNRNVLSIWLAHSFPCSATCRKRKEIISM